MKLTLSERATLLTLTAVLIAAFLMARCDPGGLPAGVQLAVDRHEAASVADTVTTHRLERVAAAAIAKSSADSAARVHAEQKAASAGRRADSLAALALAIGRTATSDSAALVAPPDSAALLWHVAYLARTDEADSLLTALHQAGAELKARVARQAASDSIADVWKAHALRGDSVIAQLLPLARHADRCRILWVVSCPTRRQALVGGLIAGAAGAIAVKR